jgi:hypothetical protein
MRGCRGVSRFLVVNPPPGEVRRRRCQVNPRVRYRIPEEKYEHLWLCAADATLIWCLWSDS